MTRCRAFVAGLVMLLVVVTLASAETKSGKSDPTWEKLKSLVGEWEGTQEGQKSTLSYRLVSSGTAIMEIIQAPDSSDMVSLYHPDGTSYLMTHYCSMGNQPRMRSRGLKDGRLEFAYVDAANLKAPDEQVMSRLVMTFRDAAHLVHEWTIKSGSKQETLRFEWTRTK